MKSNLLFIFRLSLIFNISHLDSIQGVNTDIIKQLGNVGSSVCVAMGSEIETVKGLPDLKNDDVIKVATGGKPSRIPVWIMRQAGRYLPEFRELRKKHDFFELVNTPELACEVTMQPIRRFDLDAAIIFSDILVIPQAMGLEVQMKPGVGPVLPSPLEKPEDIERLVLKPDVQKSMLGTLQAITLTRKALDGKVPLFGFSGAPWTLMSYMIEGGGSKTCQKAKAWLYKYPLESDRLLHAISEIVIQYFVAQVQYGAQILQLFESHAEYLDIHLFRQCSLPYLQRIESETNKRLAKLGVNPVPMVVFAKGGHYALKEISELNYQVVGIDWTVQPSMARKQVQPGTVLQGNLDPVALFGEKETVVKNTKRMIEAFGSKNLICNLGHGIYPETPIESVQAFIDTVHAIPLDFESM